MAPQTETATIPKTGTCTVTKNSVEPSPNEMSILKGDKLPDELKKN